MKKLILMVCLLGVAVFLNSCSETEQMPDIEKLRIADIGKLRKSAERGNAKAQNNLGVCYTFGIGVERNYVEAEKWFSKSADQGNRVAYYYLGCYYDQGMGVKQDYAEAVKWFSKAADQGHARSQYNLSSYYATGEGVTKDDAEAVKWLRKAAKNGDGIAESFLKRMSPGMELNKLLKDRY